MSENEAGPSVQSETARPAEQAASSTNESACDQCRLRKVKCNREAPRCSSCKKSDLKCSFSHRGKRVNHTKRLVGDIEYLGERLDRIERAFTSLASKLDDPASSSCRRSFNVGENIINDSSGSVLGNGPNQTDEEKAVEGTSRHRISDGTYERFFGYGSMYSLYADIAQASDDALQVSVPPSGQGTAATSPTNAANLAASFGTKPEGSSTRNPALMPFDSALEIFDDGLPTALPPRALLAAFLEPYLAELNPTLPIFGREDLLSSARKQYDSRDAVDPAWVTILNCIALEILNLKTSAGSQCEAAPHNTMDDTILMSFMANAQRCFANSAKLLKPRLANVQALLVLAIVSLKYFRYSVFEIFFSQACEIAKGIGLHQQINSSESDTEHDVSRRKLFWVLFIIDKHLCLMVGKTCHLHSFDCEVKLPEKDPQDNTSGYFLAWAKLAILQEEIYRSLYSAEAARSSTAMIQRRVDALHDKLAEWMWDCDKLTEVSTSTTPAMSCFGKELQYACYTANMLVLRRKKTSDAAAKQLDFARRALKVLASLCESRGTMIGHFFVSRVLLSYSLAPFLEVHLNLIRNWNADCLEDVSMMQQISEAGHSIATKTSGVSYSRKVQAVTSTCARVAVDIKAVKERADSDGSDRNSSTPSSQPQRPNQPTSSDPLRTETTAPSRISSTDQLLTLGPAPIHTGLDAHPLLDFNPSSAHMPRDMDFPMADFSMPEGPYSNYNLNYRQSWPTPSRALSPINTNALIPNTTSSSATLATTTSQTPSTASPDLLRFPSGMDSRYWMGESNEIFNAFSGPSGNWL